MPSSRRLVLSDEARLDLRDIRRYTAKRFGIEQRDRYYARLIQSLRLLVDFPERGVARSEPSGYRSLVIEFHVAFYRVEDDRIVVDRVLHQNRNADEELAR